MGEYYSTIQTSLVSVRVNNSYISTTNKYTVLFEESGRIPPTCPSLHHRCQLITIYELNNWQNINNCNHQTITNNLHPSHPISQFKLLTVKYILLWMYHITGFQKVWELTHQICFRSTVDLFVPFQFDRTFRISWIFNCVRLTPSQCHCVGLVPAIPTDLVSLNFVNVCKSYAIYNIYLI